MYLINSLCRLFFVGCFLPYQLVQNREAGQKEVTAIAKKGNEDKHSSGEAVDEEYKGENTSPIIKIHLAVLVHECHWLLHRTVAVDQARQNLTCETWFFLAKRKYLVHQQKVNNVTEDQCCHTEVKRFARY